MGETRDKSTPLSLFLLAHHRTSVKTIRNHRNIFPKWHSSAIILRQTSRIPERGNFQKTGEILRKLWYFEYRFSIRKLTVYLQHVDYQQENIFYKTLDFFTILFYLCRRQNIHLTKTFENEKRTPIPVQESRNFDKALLRRPKVH